MVNEKLNDNVKKSIDERISAIDEVIKEIDDVHQRIVDIEKNATLANYKRSYK